MGLLLLSVFGLMLIASLPRPLRDRERRYTATARTGAACVAVPIVLVLDGLPRGFST